MLQYGFSGITLRLLLGLEKKKKVALAPLFPPALKGAGSFSELQYARLLCAQFPLSPFGAGGALYRINNLIFSS